MRLLEVSPENIRVAARGIAKGHLVAFPTETVYGLGADAMNELAVAKIYKTKGRPLNHPLIVHIACRQIIEYWADDVCDYAFKLADNFWPGPMTLVLTRNRKAKDFITGNQSTIGLRIPCEPTALELLNEFRKLGGFGIAAPSANRYGAVSATTASAVREELEQHLDVKNDIILDGGSCQIGLESTIIDCTTSVPIILRPGAITKEQIAKSTGIQVLERTSNKIRVPGMLEVHYSPKARVVLNSLPTIGQGFIAIESILTPAGSIRLAAPRSVVEYARDIYSALRSADTQHLREVHIIEPEGDGLAAAIRDRLRRAANTNKAK